MAASLNAKESASSHAKGADEKSASKAGRLLTVLRRRSVSKVSAKKLQSEQDLDALFDEQPPTQVKGPSGTLYYGTALCYLRPSSWLRRSAICVIEAPWFNFVVFSKNIVHCSF